MSGANKPTYEELQDRVVFLEQLVQRLEAIVNEQNERIKKLDEHKAKATSAGKTDIVNAIQGLEDALKNLKNSANAKDKEAFKAAHEKVKAAREALKNAIPEKVREKIKEQRAGKKAGNTGDASQNL